MRSRASGLRHWWTQPWMWRFIPLYICLRLADFLASRPSSWPRREVHGSHTPGLSVVIAERGTPDLLKQTLEALRRACAEIQEPCQVIVLINGVSQSDYTSLQEEFTAVTWRHVRDPLGYGRAISAGLELVEHDWCYLLNSDMVLAPDALKQILAYRRPEVFAAASQIFFVDQKRRREETGWTDFHGNTGHPEIYDRTPDDGPLIRAHIYAGGGSSLYRTDVLRRYVCDASDYSPFYWEDADWGARAWADGWQVLFCPDSHAYHHHRSTIGKYYDDAQIERIVRRNAVLFDLRNALTGHLPGAQLHRVAALPAASRRELAGIGVALRALKARLAVAKARSRGFAYERLCTDEWHAPMPPANHQRRPRLLLVSPFALYPPAHGGARRIAEIIRRISLRFDVILLSDERSSYGEDSREWFSELYAVHLVEGRGDIEGEAALAMTDRMNRHAWPGLRSELRRLMALYSPDIVQIEFMELAQLVEERDRDSHWILTLHDVEPGSSSATGFRNELLPQYDGVVICTDDDRRLLDPVEATLVPNGARDRRPGATPSPENHLLFAGPFRYAPNRIGITSFIDLCWSELKRRFPDLRLTILCAGVSADVKGDPRFQQDGIELRERYEEPSAWLERCSLTINPLTDTQGSSVKLIESLLARRICVSTVDGARGFTGRDLGGLVLTENVANMLEPIATLLGNVELRHALESSKLEHLDAFTWDAAATNLQSLYTHVMES